MSRLPQNELPLLWFLFFLGPLCFPLTRQKDDIFAGVLVPAKKKRAKD